MDLSGPYMHLNLNHLKPLPPRNGFVWETSREGRNPASAESTGKRAAKWVYREFYGFNIS
jgi:hypothetical protein